uniref:Uncharacterized protein n=1 Tax=Anguilla anguilla TaxID=7936 RepID=A0A0E9SAW9_ANGAN
MTEEFQNTLLVQQPTV